MPLVYLYGYIMNTYSNIELDNILEAKVFIQFMFGMYLANSGYSLLYCNEGL